MFRLLFTNTALLAGLTALAVPVLIHLLLKRKKKRLRFSTIQFFLKQDDQSAQRRKLRNLLLLAMRLLLFALLVLAFARPYLPNSATLAAQQRPRHIVFVVDRSLSMQANSTDGVRWTRAKEYLSKILSELNSEDRAGLISCSSQSEVISELAPAPAATKLLKNLEPAYGTADLADGLKLAAKLLAYSDSAAVACTIYVISDLQRNGCRNLASTPLPQEWEVKLVNVGDLYTPNLAITEFQLEASGSSRPHVVLSNFGDEGSGVVNMNLKIDGKNVFSSSAQLKEGASTNLELSLPALSPGWHGMEARVESKDSLLLDNVRYHTIFVPEPSRVLIAESRKTKRSFEEESFFLTCALDPGDGTTNSVQSDFVLEKVAPDDVANALSLQKDRSRFALVILPGLKKIPSGMANALSSFVQAGGGVMLFLGEGISANRYNSEFRDLLPAQLGSLVDSGSDSEAGWRLGNYDTNSFIFSAFRLPNSGNLSLPEFTKRFTMTLSEASFVLAEFKDTVPLIVGRKVGQGRIVLVNTSGDTSWTDWPKHKTFVPWLHGVAHYLAGSAEKGPSQASTTFVAGNPIDVELGSLAKGLPVKLQRLGGRAVSLAADEQGTLRDLDLAVPGIYSLCNQAGQELRQLAVNVPAEESDLAAISPREFQQNLARSQDPRNTTLVAGLFGETKHQKDLWRILLLGVLALLFIELFWANRTLA